MSWLVCNAAHWGWSGRYWATTSLSRIVPRVVPHVTVHRMPRPRHVQLLRYDTQLLAVDSRRQLPVGQADPRDAEGWQSAAEDQPLPGLHARRDDRNPWYGALPLCRQPGQWHSFFAGLGRVWPTWRRILRLKLLDVCNCIAYVKIYTFILYHRYRCCYIVVVAMLVRRLHRVQCARVHCHNYLLTASECV